jgi:flagellar motility protein MotE (MotC chaperone)
MGDLIKIISVALVIALVFTAGLVFGVPSVRTGVMAKIKGEKAGETPEAKALQAEKEEKDRIIVMLKDKEEELKKREETISEQEKRISSLKGEVESLKKTVDDTQGNIERYVVSIDESQRKNIKKLSEIFSKMTPEDAAEIMGNLNDRTLVSILASMKERSSARLLGTYSALGEEQAKRAAVLSEMMKQVVQK